jgi:HK97 family phage major capsid protein
MTKAELDALIAAKADEVRKEFKTKIQNENPGNSLDVLIKSDSDKVEIKKLQSRNDDILLTSAIMYGTERDGRPSPRIKELNIYKSFMRDIETNASELLKAAMGTGTTGYGPEWIPTGWSNSLVAMFELTRTVAAAFPSFVMPQNPFNYPAQTSRTTAYIIAEGADATDSNIGTSYVQFDAKRLTVSCPVTRELEEDSIISMLPAIKGDIANTLSRAEENALINGFNGNTYDSDNSAASNALRIYSGLRPLALANSYTTDVGTSFPTLAQINAMCKLLGIYYQPSDCIWIAGTSVWTQLRGLTDANNNALVVTLDKMGPAATIKTGVLGELFGSPVYRSEFMRETLNTLGKYDASTTTKAGLLLVNTKGFMIGNRRGITVESDYRPRTQTTDIVASMRQAFMPMHAIASNHMVHFGINVTT